MVAKTEGMKPYLKQTGGMSSGVSGIIAFTGSVRGSIVVCMPLDVASELIKCFVGGPLPPDHPDFADAIGELVNMIAGGAKTMFNEPAVTIGCPSVIVGKEHQVFQRKDDPIIIIPCICGPGTFTVEVALRPEKNPALASKEATVKVA